MPGLGLALVLLLAACSSTGVIMETEEGSTGGQSHLVSSASNPASGDATLTEAATLTIDADGNGMDELALQQTIGETLHEVVVTWDTMTHVIQGVSHVWSPGQDHGSPTAGFTACFAGINDCDPVKVTLDFSGQTVTLAGQVLDDVFGGAKTSTLTGTMVW
jgi:hypothetical protein